MANQDIELSRIAREFLRKTPIIGEQSVAWLTVFQWLEAMEPKETIANAQEPREVTAST